MCVRRNERRYCEEKHTEAAPHEPNHLATADGCSHDHVVHNGDSSCRKHRNRSDVLRTISRLNYSWTCLLGTRVYCDNTLWTSFLRVVLLVRWLFGTVRVGNGESQHQGAAAGSALPSDNPICLATNADLLRLAG